MITTMDSASKDVFRELIFISSQTTCVHKYLDRDIYICILESTVLVISFLENKINYCMCVHMLLNWEMAC